MSTVNLKMIHSSFTVLDLAALNHSPVCCLPFAFLFKCRHQFCGADCPVRHVKLLSGFGLHKKTHFLRWSHLVCWSRSPWNLRSLLVIWVKSWDLGRWLNWSNLSVPLYTVDSCMWIRRGQFSFIDTDFFYVVTQHVVCETQWQQSGENRRSNENVINGKPECSTVKHNSNGLPGENKVMKRVWLKGMKTA